MLATPRVKLTPVEPALGDSGHARAAETTMMLRRNTKDSQVSEAVAHHSAPVPFDRSLQVGYTVQDPDGYTVVVARAKSNSLRNEIDILDDDGSALYEIKDRLSVHRTMEGKRGSHHIFEVQNENTHKGTTDHESVMTGWWKDASSTHHFAIKGNWYKGEAVVWLTRSNHPIGTILTANPTEGRHREAAKDDEDGYIVHVAPGVDLQVFAGICIAAETILSKETA